MKTPQQRLDYAYNCLVSGQNLTEAIHELESLLQTPSIFNQTEQLTVIYYLGLSYERNGNFREAINIYLRALEAVKVPGDVAKGILIQLIPLMETYLLLEPAAYHCELALKWFGPEPWFSQKLEACRQVLEAAEYQSHSNLNNWKNLQQQGYFKHHVHYQVQDGLSWDGQDVERVERYLPLNSEQVMVVIGCGYGRDSLLFAPRVKRIYGIDVTDEILQEAANNLKARGCDNFVPVLADNWKTLVPERIDLVYTVTVFQHLTKYLVSDYVQGLAQKLKPGGSLVCQFMQSRTTGSYDATLTDYEPHISWSKDEIRKLMQKAGLDCRQIDTNRLDTREELEWHWVHAQKL